MKVVIYEDFRDKLVQDINMEFGIQIHLNIMLIVGANDIENHNFFITLVKLICIRFSYSLPCSV